MSTTDDALHPLYRAADKLIQRGMSRRQMIRLHKLFNKHSLPLPADLAIMIVEAGITL